ncbi:MAG TPA: cytochrome c biogenesis protein CcdA [Polyangiaceae bacterium]|nr:cytochrome c biogenesis protein CcdA [Polyangiaceae bacterium]
MKTLALLAATATLFAVRGAAAAGAEACKLAGGAAGSQASDAFTTALAKGPVYAGIAAWLGGLLVSLTPCVYPMVAVTVSVFGARESRSRLQGTLLSAAFVLGIVAMFVPLGVFAGVTGSAFGSVLQSSWVVLGISLLFLVMAASMFGAFDLALPAAWTNRLAELGGIGYKGAFLLGLACGPIAAPCSGPVLTGILTWIAKTQSAGLGALAMGTFALGLGAPFFLVGAFALQLPKSGRWMMHIKSLLGIVLVVVALYFLSTAFPVLSDWARRSTPFFVIAGIALLAGLGLGAVHRSFEEPGSGAKLRKSAGIALTSAAAFGILSAAGQPARTLSWHHGDVREARARALREEKPLLVDFTASWCGACKELDRHTFAEERVAREAGRFLAVKVDATNDEDPRVEAALQEFNVVGLPTVVLYDSRGKEALRCTDFVSAEPFLEAIRRVN